jgi:hypothetical protein
MREETVFLSRDGPSAAPAGESDVPGRGNMRATPRRWARHVHIKTGALRGWCAKCPAERRRKALRSVVRADGYAVAVRRLNFLGNVANRTTNPALRTAARRDVRWMERTLRTKKHS